MSDDCHTPNSEVAPESVAKAAEQQQFESVTIRSYLSNQFGVGELAQSKAQVTEPKAVSEPSSPSSKAPVAPPVDANAELAKWRERVPKLAAALKVRTARVELLEAELERSQAGGAGIQARDEHIAALESKLVTLTGRYQASEGNLRARELELEDSTADLTSLKARWQALTSALDEQVALVAQGEQSVTDLTARLTAAEQREAHQQTQNASLTQALADFESRTAELVEQQELLEQAFAAEKRELSHANEAAAQAQKQAHEQALAAQGAEATRQLDEAKQAGANLAIELSDAQADVVELQGVQQDLQSRNYKLLETTELANRQLETLADDLGRLRASLAERDEQLAQQTSQHQQALQQSQQDQLLEVAQIQAEHSQRLRDIHAQTLLVFEALEQQQHSQQCEAVAQAEAELSAGLQQTQNAELETWQTELVDLQHVAATALQQLRPLAAEKANLQAQVATLTTDLAQQSARCEKLTQSLLQQEQTWATEQQQALANQAEQLRAQGNQYTQQLEQRKQELELQLVRVREEVVAENQLVDLLQACNEQQYPAVLGSISDLNPAPDADPAPSTTEQLQVQLNEQSDELEQTYELLAQLQAPALLAVTSVVPSPAVEPTSVSDLFPAKQDESLDRKSMLVLHQQLTDMQDENSRLREQLIKTNEALHNNDDLTRLKGVGAKLAEQLRDLGIEQFRQIADLRLEELEDEQHPLFNLRGRIDRDAWVEQAKRFVASQDSLSN